MRWGDVTVTVRHGLSAVPRRRFLSRPVRKGKGERQVNRKDSTRVGASRGVRVWKARSDVETDAVVGTLTHRLVAAVLREQQEGAVPVGSDVAAALIEMGSGVVAAVPDLGSHRSRVRLRVITCAGQYLNRFRPPVDVEFVGSEVPVREGVVDLVWRHPTLGVFFDELKTTRRAAATLSPTAAEQVRRYARSGVAEWGEVFAGVRFIPLLHPASALLAVPAGEDVDLVPLAGSALSTCSIVGWAA